MNRYKLLHIKQQQDLLYITVNNTQYLIITYKILSIIMDYTENNLKNFTLCLLQSALLLGTDIHG